MTLFSVARSIWWQRCRGLQLIRYGRWTSAWLSIFVAPPTNASKAPFATSINGLLTMSSIHISSKIDVTRTKRVYSPAPLPLASSLSALWTYGWMAYITCSSINDSFIINCQFGSLQLIHLLTLVHHWMDRWGWMCFRCPMSSLHVIARSLSIFSPYVVTGWMIYVIYLSTRAYSEINIIFRVTWKSPSYLFTDLHPWVDGLMDRCTSHFSLKHNTLWHINPLYIHIHWFHVCGWRVDLSSITFQTYCGNLWVEGETNCLKFV